MKPRTSLIMVFLFMLSLPVLAVTGPLEKAINAYGQQQYKQAYELLLPLAQKNVAEAQYYLGGMLVEGIGVPADPKQGVYWLEQAVKNRHHMAARMLGNMYLSGMGVPMDPQKGAQYILLFEKQAPEEETDSGCD